MDVSGGGGLESGEAMKRAGVDMEHAGGGHGGEEEEEGQEGEKLRRGHGHGHEQVGYRRTSGTVKDEKCKAGNKTRETMNG